MPNGRSEDEASILYEPAINAGKVVEHVLRRAPKELVVPHVKALAILSEILWEQFRIEMEEDMPKEITEGPFNDIPDPEPEEVFSKNDDPREPSEWCDGALWEGILPPKDLRVLYDHWRLYEYQRITNFVADGIPYMLNVFEEFAAVADGLAEWPLGAVSIKKLSARFCGEQPSIIATSTHELIFQRALIQILTWDTGERLRGRTSHQLGPLIESVIPYADDLIVTGPPSTWPDTTPDYRISDQQATHLKTQLRQELCRAWKRKYPNRDDQYETLSADSELFAEYRAATRSPRRSATANTDRDRWLYEQCCEFTKYSTIISRLAKKTEWEPIESIGGVKTAANRYARCCGLPLIPKRQPGRPST